jgi:hypothetical protein
VACSGLNTTNPVVCRIPLPAGWYFVTACGILDLSVLLTCCTHWRYICWFIPNVVVFHVLSKHLWSNCGVFCSLVSTVEWGLPASCTVVVWFAAGLRKVLDLDSPSQWSSADVCNIIFSLICEGASNVTVRVFLLATGWRLIVPLPLNVIDLVLFVAISSTH